VNLRHCLLGLSLLALAAPAAADPVLQYQIDLHGDLTVIGNTLGQECNVTTAGGFITGGAFPDGGALGLITGRVGACGSNLADTAPDVYWLDVLPDGGGPLADLSISPLQARTTAVLTLPAGATVSYARLYWAAMLSNAAVDGGSAPGTTVTFGVPNGAPVALTADRSVPLDYAPQPGFYYQSSKDVSDLVKQSGAGAYSVTGVSSIDFRNLNESTSFAGWSLLVIYNLPSDPLRDIAIFEGLDPVSSANATSNMTVSGFRVPDSGFDGKITVVAYEGDSQITGDKLFFDGLLPDGGFPGTRLPLADLPDGGDTNNFFNGTRSTLGQGASNAGDLPRHTGEPGSKTGMDIDVVDIASHIAQGQTTARMTATSTGDTYFFGVVATSIATYKPVFTDMTKSVTDLTVHTGDAPGTVRAGDTLEYAISGTNSGNDASTETVLVDAIPAGVTFVPGSLVIVSGTNAGAKTDATGDDQADFSAGTVTFRLGTGATATVGGSVGIGEGFSVKFQVTVDAAATGVVANQASISFKGFKGAPLFSTASSGAGGQFSKTPVTVVATPPPTVTSPAAGSTVPTTTPTFTGTGVNGETVVVKAADGTVLCTTTVVNGTYSCTSTVALPQGSNTVTVTQGSGGAASGGVSVTFTVDSTPPVVTFTSTPAANSNSGGGTFRFTAVDSDPAGVSSVTCSLDGAPPTACTSPQAVSGLADGLHTFTVTATDPAGNVGTATYSWQVDTDPPVVTITSGPPAQTNQPSGNITYAVADADATATTTTTCTLDGSTTPCSGGMAAYNNLPDGSHTFTVTVTDSAGNSSSASTTFTVDTVAPSLAVTSPASGATVGANPTFTGQTDPAQAGRSVTVTVQGKTCTAVVQADGSFSCSVGPLTAGSATATVSVTDAAGNTTTVSVPVTVDTTPPPPPTITSGPSGLTSNRSPSFAYTDSKSPVTYRCSIDGAAFTPCTDPQTFGPLADGMHTLAVEAVDAAGNVSTPTSQSFTVDATPPAVPVLTSPSAQATQLPTFTGRSGEPGSTVSVTVDGRVVCTAVVQADGTFSCTATSPIADGNHSVTVSATDAAGNTATGAGSTLTIDTAPPDTTITQAPSATSGSSAASFTFTSNETAVTYQCALDGAVFAACQDPQGYTGLVDGVHTFAVRAVDAAGNIDPTPATYSWTVQSQPPAAPSVDSPQQGQSVPTTTPTFTGLGTPGSTVTVRDGSGTVLCTAVVDAAGHYSCTSTVALPQGAQTITATAVDGAGNSSGATTVGFTVDTSAPTTTIVSGPPAVTASTSASFTFSSNESPVTYLCTLDAQAPVSCSNPALFTGLSTGMHHLKVQARDAAGNLDPVGATQDWRVDPTSTSVVVVSPAPGSATSDPKPSIVVDAPAGTTVTVTVTDAQGNVVATCVQVASATGVICPITTALPDGGYTVSVTAVNGTGQTVGSTTSTFTEDHTAPSTTITTKPNLISGSSTAVFGYTSNESGVTYLCSLDGAPRAPCPDPSSYTGLGNGPHTFTVWAVDAAGNVDPTGASYSWTVQSTPLPQPILTSPGNGGSVATTTPTFTGTATPGSTVTVTDSSGAVICTAVVDASGNYSCTATTPLSPGTHGVTVVQTDSGGNSSPPLHSTFTVDTTPPSTFFVTTPPATGADSTVTFSYGSNKPNVTYLCALDGAAAVPCPDPSTYTGLTPGSHTLVVKAVDAAGNVDPLGASDTFVVGSTAPLTLTSPTNGGVVGTSTPVFSGAGAPGSTVTVTVDGQVVCTATVDASGKYSCTPTTPLPDGQHAVTVTARDGSGTVVGTVSGSFGIDTSPVRTFIVSGPPHANAPTSATFEFASNKSGVTYQCALDGGTFVPCPNPQTYAGLAAGAHHLVVRAVDGAGNVDPVGATYDWSVVGTGTSGSSGSVSGSSGSTASSTASGSTASSSSGSSSASGSTASGSTASSSASGSTASGSTASSSASGSTASGSTASSSSGSSGSISGSTGRSSSGSSGTVSSSSGSTGGSATGGQSSGDTGDLSSRGSVAGGGCGAGGSGLSLLGLGAGLWLLARRRRTA
jgi:hypothetical protein